MSGLPAEEVAPPSPAPEETPQNNPLPSQPNQPPAAEKSPGSPDREAWTGSTFKSRPTSGVRPTTP